VVNLSQESPQKDSWVETPQAAIEKMLTLHQHGADFIDVGARSSFSKSPELDDSIEAQRLESFFSIPRPNSFVPMSLDTWSHSNASRYLSSIAALNYTSTDFPDSFIDELANTGCPVVLNYLPAANPYALRKTAYTPPSVNLMLDYFAVTVHDLQNRGVKVMAIDPNLGMWHPDTPNELKPIFQRQIIEALPEVKKIAPAFIVAPRTNGLLNTELVELILSKGVDFVRTHDVVALKAIMKRFDSLKTLSYT